MSFNFSLKDSLLYLLTPNLLETTFLSYCYWFLSSVQFSFSLSVVSDSLQHHGPRHARPRCPSPTSRVYPNSCPSSRWCHPNISSSVIPFSSAFNLSQHQGLFKWVSSSSTSAFNEHSRLISFRMDWLDLLAVQGTLKSLLQHNNSKALILRRSAFFTVQISHPYMTTGKTIALTRQNIVGKLMSLIFNMLSKFITAFFQGASIF